MYIPFKNFMVGLISIFVFDISIAQNAGKVIETLNIESNILSRNVRYAIYLPSDYSTSERTYPVVYLLHGHTDDNTSWLQAGEINRYADKAIADGTIPPMIIVMPDADSSFYINSYDGDEKYEDFFINEFIPSIEKTYRIKNKKRFRGIAGLSMGGYGSLLYTIKYPDLFAAAGCLSAAVFDDDSIVNMPEKSYQYIYGQLFGRNLKGKERLNRTWYSNSILKLVEIKSTADLSKVRYWIDCGDDDFLSTGNCLLHMAFIEKKVPHEFRIRNGAHNWTYWRTGITDALQFIGQSFH